MQGGAVARGGAPVRELCRGGPGMLAKAWTASQAEGATGLQRIVDSNKGGLSDLILHIPRADTFLCGKPSVRYVWVTQTCVLLGIGTLLAPLQWQITKRKKKTKVHCNFLVMH